MAKITPFGQPANDSERDAIYFLRRLPETFEIFHNLEIKQNKETFEVDLVILAPHCVFVVDVKGTRGRIEVIGPRWYPENRQAYGSPVAKLRNIAKVLNTLFKDSNRLKPDLGKVHVHAVTLMMAEDVSINDPDGRDSNHITYCDDRCLSYFQSRNFIPEHRLTDIRAFFPDIKRALQGKARPKSAPPRYRDWQVEEELGRSDRYVEYRARHLLMGTSGWTARLRVYRVDPYQNASDRETEKKLISNAFKSIYQVPKHPNILSVQEFFEAEDGDCFVLVTEDIPGQALRQHITRQTASLNQKFSWIEQVLIALDHAHKHGVIHRNLTPDNVLIGTSGQVHLIGFDYARVVGRESTIAHEIVDELEGNAVYQATECYRDPAKASATSDLFSAGLVFYELLTGQRAFETVEQICDRAATFPTKASSLQPALSDGMDKWLQKLCAFEPVNRFTSADSALQDWSTLATLQNTDLANLPANTPIDNRYRVIERLGHPGSFAVAYKVVDALDDTVLVLKLVTRDRRSVYERLRQEYKTLRQLPEHPHIVKVEHAGFLKDDTPFITFEYVEGQDVGHCIESNSLNLELAVQIAQQTAIGLAHLHQSGVYHQDIKPSNLLLTNQGIRIIDFNIAVSDHDEVTVSAGTRKYLPPDFKPSLNPTVDEKVDRDLYALGITFYECVTGRYPFEESSPPPGKLPENPNETQDLETLSDQLVQVLFKVIAPKRSARFTTAAEFLDAITALTSLRKVEEEETEATEHVEQIPVEQALIEQTSDSTAKDTANNSDVVTTISPQAIAPSRPEQPIEAFQAGELQREELRAEVALPAQSEVLRLQPTDFTAKQTGYTSEINSGRLIAAEKRTAITLFDRMPPSAPSQSWLNRGKSGKSVVLDPTGLYSPPARCIEIKTEAEWMKFFFQSDGLYWVTGRGPQAKRLCDWTREWLRVWNRLDLVLEEKQNPRDRLQEVFGTVPIPAAWTEPQILQLAAAIDTYPSENPVAHLLADIIDAERQVWFEPPSIRHLAQWLSVQVPDCCQPLERIWQNQIAVDAAELADLYQTEDKLQLLRQWTGIIQPLAKIKVLNQYPLPIPYFFADEFQSFWERRVLSAEGKAIDKLAPNKQSGMEQIAPLAYRILKARPSWITSERKRKLASYLNYQELRELDSLQPPPAPSPLAITASSKDALQWVTDQYLPFRRWDAAINSSEVRPRVSDRLADSFVNWLLQHYPDLRFESAVLNYSVASLVQDLCQKHPVLWIVVDGLGWLDHQELLAYLTRNGSFSVETALQPKISILPTKTEYAKWSLYSQLPPSHSAWVPDAGKGFSMVGTGKRYTDRDYKRGTLHRDLKKRAHPLYCWDTDKFDHLYHTEQDWQNLYQIQRPHVLEGIARDIEYCVKQYPNPEQLKVVIASDHGQMIGAAEQLPNCPEGLDLKGRMAIGKTDDPRFMILEAERYGLPHDLSIVRGAACLNAFSYTEKNEIIGSHGGLFPEEVVVGVSVLRSFTARFPIQITCYGEGEAGQSGELTLAIDNPNTVPLTQLCLYINELPNLKAGYPLEINVPAGQKIQAQVPIPSYPELPPNHEGKQLALTGELQFLFADFEAGTANLNVESRLMVKQLFSSGLDIDDFL
jgi:serine/threonine protein kinase